MVGLGIVGINGGSPFLTEFSTESLRLVVGREYNLRLMILAKYREISVCFKSALR
jgi:hypothetical protein